MPPLADDAYVVWGGLVIVVADEYVDVETAKRTGQASFGRMLDDIRKDPGTRIVLVEKTDHRNLKDWVILDELEVEVHLDVNSYI